MKLVTDPHTGELLEVLPDNLVGGEPYDYADYRRATMAASREHRAAIQEARDAGEALAKAEADYRRELALAVGRLKAEHGATVAEVLAKGAPAVTRAREEMKAAEARDRAAMETIRLCRDDRSGLLTLGAWSRQANADGWQDAP